MTTKKRIELVPTYLRDYNNKVLKAISRGTEDLNKGRSPFWNEGYITDDEKINYFSYDVDNLIESADECRMFGIVREPSNWKSLMQNETAIPKITVTIKEAPRQKYKNNRRLFDAWWITKVQPIYDFENLLATLPYLKTTKTDIYNDGSIKISYDKIKDGITFKRVKNSDVNFFDVLRNFDSFIMDRLIDNDIVKEVATKSKRARRYYRGFVVV